MENDVFVNTVADDDTVNWVDDKNATIDVCTPDDAPDVYVNMPPTIAGVNTVPVPVTVVNVCPTVPFK